MWQVRYTWRGSPCVPCWLLTSLGIVSTLLSGANPTYRQISFASPISCLGRNSKCSLARNNRARTLSDTNTLICGLRVNIHQSSYWVSPQTSSNRYQFIFALDALGTSPPTIRHEWLDDRLLVFWWIGFLLRKRVSQVPLTFTCHHAYPYGSETKPCIQFS